MFKSFFTPKQLETLSAQNLTYLIYSFSQLSKQNIDEEDLNELCRISQKDKKTKQKLVDLAFCYQQLYNGLHIDISIIRSIDSVSPEEYLVAIVKQSLRKLLEIADKDVLLNLTADNYNKTVGDLLKTNKNYKLFEIYIRYLPNPAKVGYDRWIECAKLLDEVFKNTILSNMDVIRFYLISRTMKK